MSILETRAPVLPKLWSLPHTLLSPVVRFGVTFFEAFSEALDQAHEARRRFPFCDW